MKYKVLLVLLIFNLMYYPALSNEQNNSSGSKNWKISTPDSVAKQANKCNNGPLSEGIISPGLDSALNGFSNMLQGTTGIFYGGEEQIKQQKEFARQQLQNIETDE